MGVCIEFIEYIPPTALQGLVEYALNFVTRDRQKAPEIAPLFNAGWPETRKFLPVSTRSYCPSLDTSVIRPLAPTAQPALEAMEADLP